MLFERESPQRERYFMRHASRTNAAATLDRDAPGPPRGHARTERTATITFPHQLRAQPPKARAHASTFGKVAIVLKMKIQGQIK